MKGMYNGVAAMMQYTFFLPQGAAKLAGLNTNLSKEAKLRSKRFDYYHTAAKISPKPYRHFGISSKNFL